MTPSTQANTFPKQERLCSRKEIADLFATGSSVFVYPFKCVFKLNDKPSELSGSAVRMRMMVSVGKRYHKRAVRRNRVKRLIREAYRLSKSSFLSGETCTIPEGKILDICFIYHAKTEETFKNIDYGVKKSYLKIQENINSSSLPTH